MTFTAEDLARLRDQGLDRTDWPRVKALTDEEVEHAAACDPEEADLDIDWDRAVVAPARKATMTIRLDPDVLAYFRQMGRGYQTRINAVLRAYMEHRLRSGGSG